MLLPRRSDLRAMFDLALPVVAVQLGLQLMGVVDTLMVGHVSPQALAATALGNLFFFAVSIFGMGLLMALDPLVAQAVGARDHEAIAWAIQRGAVLALGLTVLTSLALLPAEPALRMLGQPADVVPDAAVYAHWRVPGVPAFFAFIVVRQSLQAMGRVAPLVVAVALANVLNALLDWALIYGELGAPRLGVRGASLATSISQWALTIGLFAITWRDLRPYLVPVRAAALGWRPLARTTALGAPIGLQYGLEYGAFAFVALMMGWIGTVPMAAHQIAINLASLTFMVPFGVSAAAAVLVGQAVGRGDDEGARRAATSALAFGVGFMVLSAIAFLAMPELLARAYSDDAEVVTLAAALLPIAGLFQVFDGTQSVAAGVLRGIGDTRAPMTINVVGFWLLGLPASWLLGFRLGHGPLGIWWGVVLGLFVVALLLLARIGVRMRRVLRRLHV